MHQRWVKKSLVNYSLCINIEHHVLEFWLNWIRQLFERSNGRHFVVMCSIHLCSIWLFWDLIVENLWTFRVAVEACYGRWFLLNANLNSTTSWEEQLFQLHHFLLQFPKLPLFFILRKNSINFKKSQKKFFNFLIVVMTCCLLSSSAA